MKTRDLAVLREVVGGLPTAPPADEHRGPAVDPRLVTTYSPRASWRDEGGEEAASSQLFHTPLERFCCELPGSAPGLVIGRNSDTPPRRNGWNGLTSAGRQGISRSCAALEDQRARCAFWTITLSDAQLLEIDERDTWPDFQNAIRHRLQRALRRKKLRGLVVGVVELHPQRSARMGLPCPHLHVVFVGRTHRKAPWALSREDLDGIIRQALESARVGDLETKASGNVQPVKKSVGAYLSHYMKKGSGPPSVWGRGFCLCPRQWWFQSRSMRRLVIALTVRLPLDFVAFCHQRWSHLTEQGWASWQPITLADPRAPATFSFLWTSVESVGLALAWWQESVWEADWWLNYRLLYDRPVPADDPQWN